MHANACKSRARRGTASGHLDADADAGTPPGEDYVTWYSAGKGRFEQRKGNELNTSVIVLPQGLTSSR